MEISVREDAVHSSADGADLRDGGLFDRDAAGEVAVAVQQRSRSVQRVARVIDGGTLNTLRENCRNRWNRKITSLGFL